MHPILFHHNLLVLRPDWTETNIVSESEKGGFLRRWWRTAIRSWKRRKLIAALQKLDDRGLRDMGISRKDIGRIVDALHDRDLGMVPFAADQPSTGEYQGAV
ncbi:hypothetical protein GCM10016455_07800 [Aliiroseovarius zhejiangensis]|uniref:YjiS-like domain-containing protein n=1 Tax=Aliiroseovarius zhejiangensis TaxID=1632025 RepID=A0ABQ3IV02_9RHOB|nr:DUF1127 domain-containing protein [Aliiroseovarius zhejiangensis]GHE89932.1 hypothetical protein GCM10016455_07800 [Aliiroseovarius zhejiangensis]